jgi:hypothetical protein
MWDTTEPLPALPIEQELPMHIQSQNHPTQTLFALLAKFRAIG